jgi:HTH-type transcriptional regulator/antitoxin HigA
LLTIVVRAFEEKHYSLPALPPNERLREVVAQRGLTHKDLAAIVGNKGLTSEIFAGRRKVSPAIAKRVSAALHVPVAALL